MAMGSSRGATLGANTFTGNQAITGNLTASGVVGIGGVSTSTIRLRITGIGAATDLGLYIIDNGGNENLVVFDNGSVKLGRTAPATTATTGRVYIPACAGTPTGVPVAQAGFVAIQYDTTNKQFWIYDGAWLQPKTPAAAAIITWQ
jgi:hypothetical protein